MKRVLVAALLLVALAGAAAAASLAPQQRHVISGKDYLIVAAAVAAAPEHRDPVEAYGIHIYEDDTTYVVVFLDPDRPHGRGSTSLKMFEFEVELNKHDLSPIRWYGVR